MNKQEIKEKLKQAILDKNSKQILDYTRKITQMAWWEVDNVKEALLDDIGMGCEFYYNGIRLKMIDGYPSYNSQKIHFELISGITECITYDEIIGQPTTLNRVLNALNAYKENDDCFFICGGSLLRHDEQTVGVYERCMYYIHICDWDIKLPLEEQTEETILSIAKLLIN